MSVLFLESSNFSWLFEIRFVVNQIEDWKMWKNRVQEWLTVFSSDSFCIFAILLHVSGSLIIDSLDRRSVSNTVVFIHHREKVGRDMTASSRHEQQKGFRSDERVSRPLLPVILSIFFLHSNVCTLLSLSPCFLKLFQRSFVQGKKCAHASRKIFRVTRLFVQD